MHIQYISNPSLICSTMWTFLVHQEQREMAAMQLGKEHFLKKSLPFIFLPFIPYLLLHYCFSKNVSPYVLLFNLQTDSSGLWIRMEKWEHMREAPSETLWRQASTQILGHFCSSSNTTRAAFFFSPIWLYVHVCFFPDSKSASYLRTSQFLWLYCKTGTECMMITWSTLKYCV